MPKQLYLSDVIADRQRIRDEEAVRWAEQDAQKAAREAKFRIPEDLHPGIGVLTSAEGVRFYAHLGRDRVYTEGSVEELTATLQALSARRVCTPR